MGLTTFFVFIGLTVDIVTEQKIILWLVFLSSSFVLFLLGIMAKYFPKVVIVLDLLFLTYISLYGIFVLFSNGTGLMLPQIVALFSYVIVMAITNYITLRKLASGSVVELDIKERKTNKITIYSKLRRSKSRGKSSRSNTSTNVKAGAFRG